MRKMSKVLALVLCLSVMLAMLVGCGLDGTYYLMENGEKNPTEWITIDGDEWEDSNGLYGVVQEDGDTVTLSIDLFSTYIDVIVGTIDGDTFTCEFLGDALVYQK